MKKKDLMFLLLGTALFSSCFRDEYNFENVKLDYSPTFALPLLEANVITKDLLQDIDTTLISADANNLLRVSISDTLKVITFSDIIAGKNFESSGSTTMNSVVDANTKNFIALLVATMQPLPATTGLNGGTHGGGTIAGLDSVKFLTADLAITFTNNTPVDMSDIAMEMVSVKNNVIIDTIFIPSVPAGQSATGIGSFANKVLRDSIIINMYSFGTPGATHAAISSLTYNESIDFATSMTNVSIDYFYGDLTGQLIPSTNDNIAFGFGDDPLLAAFKVADPNVKIYFDNGFGVPFELTTLDLIMKGGSSDVALNGYAKPFKIGGATSLSAATTTTLSFDNTTNIADGLNSGPSTVGFNVAGGVDSTILPRKHFATKDSKFIVRMDVDVPVYGKIQNMGVRDTMDFDGSIFESAKSITLRATIENDFPLDGELQMLFTDESYNLLDSLVSAGGDGKFMSASSIYTSGSNIGTTQTPSTKSTDFVINEAKAKKLANAKYAIVVVKINSANGGNTAVKILSTYNMNIKLGVIAKISTSDLIGE